MNEKQVNQVAVSITVYVITFNCNFGTFKKLYLNIIEKVNEKQVNQVAVSILIAILELFKKLLGSSSCSRNWIHFVEV